MRKVIFSKMSKKMQMLDWKLLLIFTVVFAHLPVTYSQSYIWTFGDNHPSFFSLNDFRQFNYLEKLNNNRSQTDPLSGNKPLVHATLSATNINNIKKDSSSEESNLSVEEDILEEDNTTKIIFIRKSLNENPNEFSKTAMDVITIVWYVATFLALAAFFMLMACSDRRCNDTQQRPNQNSTANIETPVAPPTPSPSYSEFAPPSYESVIKMQQEAKANIFIIPLSSSVDEVDKDSSVMAPSAPSPTHLPSPPVTFYTVNELQKLGS